MIIRALVDIEVDDALRDSDLAYTVKTILHSSLLVEEVFVYGAQEFILETPLTNTAAPV